MAVHSLSQPARGDEPEPIRVVAQAAPGTHYVGEAIDFAIGVVAEGERPRIVPPQVAGAEVIPAGTDLKPLSTSAIGDVVEETNLFRYRFRLVPKRAGVIEVPPFRVRLGARSGASRPVRLTVRALPASGRPAGFLGGVGRFEVTAEARPATVRNGQVLEYRIVVTGPGARGMTGAPALRRFDQVPLGLEIEPMPPEAVADPPSRVFRYRLRPTRAGAATLPPVAVAAFDPESAQYVTRVTPGVAIRVADVPRLNPATVAYTASTSSGNTRARVFRGWALAASATGLGMAAAALRIVRRKQARDSRDARAGRLIDRLIGALRAGPDAAAGRRITEGLIAYLNVKTGRLPGALTPEEASREFTEASRCVEIGERARQLVARCDQAQYARQGPSAEELTGAAIEFWEELKGSAK